MLIAVCLTVVLISTVSAQGMGMPALPGMESVPSMEQYQPKMDGMGMGTQMQGPQGSSMNGAIGPDGFAMKGARGRRAVSLGQLLTGV